MPKESFIVTLLFLFILATAELSARIVLRRLGVVAITGCSIALALDLLEFHFHGSNFPRHLGDGLLPGLDRAGLAVLLWVPLSFRSVGDSQTLSLIVN